MSDESNQQPPAPSGEPPRDVLVVVSKLKASFKFCEDAFAQLDDAKLAESITLTFGGQSQQRPRVSMLIGHSIDMADHYSQLANYMRLNNILPPTALFSRPPPAKREARAGDRDAKNLVPLRSIQAPPPTVTAPTGCTSTSPASRPSRHTCSTTPAVSATGSVLAIAHTAV